MLKKKLREKVKILSSLPKRRIKDKSTIEHFDDEKIHNICEACFNIVHKKLPLEKKRKNNLNLVCLKYTKKSED